MNLNINKKKTNSNLTPVSCGKGAGPARGRLREPGPPEGGGNPANKSILSIIYGDHIH